MNVLAVLIPVTLALGGIGLAAFFWSLRHNQYDDPQGHAERILSDRYDDRPAAGRSNAESPRDEKDEPENG